MRYFLSPFHPLIRLFNINKVLVEDILTYVRWYAPAPRSQVPTSDAWPNCGAAIACQMLPNVLFQFIEFCADLCVYIVFVSERN